MCACLVFSLSLLSEIVSLLGHDHFLSSISCTSHRTVQLSVVCLDAPGKKRSVLVALWLQCCNSDDTRGALTHPPGNTNSCSAWSPPRHGRTQEDWNCFADSGCSVSPDYSPDTPVCLLETKHLCPFPKV
jgi:hypothetical protein